MSRLYDDLWAADQRRRAAQRGAARSGDPLEVSEPKLWVEIIRTVNTLVAAAVLGWGILHSCGLM